MYKYIVQDEVREKDHFHKCQHFDEVESYVCKNSMGSSLADSSLGETTYKNGNEAEPVSYQSGVHVYRIKDLVDAITTSIIMDGSKKEDYIQKLSNQDSEFNADREFIEICHNLGECDVQ
ncbi:MAG: hypothetical protein E7256_10540 [Lachnospiraceae bacterium]|nr:hypothetical protein [Lachnospiraceae bacterium]